MLQIKHICKEYKTGTLIQKALDDVSLNLRDNEFVAILGPSGSGKSTLLNIIGGLDQYDSGDLIINEISTKEYKDRDWDSYRNHTIGFIFQSYNLIPHQTVLANVELALTISGIDKAERKKMAIEALKQVGLGDQLHKKPNQMSGGQMQRVAIARALVNDPDILLADEPTGALDSETSVQVMELLQEVAKDRLVVMVTHNPELADEYATRIVKLRDGKICSDSKEFLVNEESLMMPEHKNMGKSSMSFLTALSLSFNNLRTKKARTLLTSFAGSIGIIGIALILSLSTGVSDYIKNIEKETLSEYPLQIQNTGFDITSMMIQDEGGDATNNSGDIKVIQMVTDMFSKMNSNDLGSLKTYLDSGDSGIEKYTSAVEYSYQVTPQIYRQDGDQIRQVNPDRSFEALGLGSAATSNSMMSAFMGTNIFHEMPQNMDMYEQQYDVKKGRWPNASNECVVVLTSSGKISDFMLYALGLRDPVELDKMVQQFIDEENVSTPADIGTYTYEQIVGTEFKLVDSAGYYQYDDQYKVWKDKTSDEAYMRQLVKNSADMRVVGVVQPSEEANGAILQPGIAYPESLTRHVVAEAKQQEIVRQQMQNPEKNVFTNELFGENKEGEFDTASLFTVEEDALKNAFKFDQSALSKELEKPMNLDGALNLTGSMPDLSGLIDLGAVNIDLVGMPQLNLGEIMSGLDISVSEQGLEKMAFSLMEGYQEYAKSNPQADYSNLGTALETFFSTPEAQSILSRHIASIIKSSGGVEISMEQLQKMFGELMTGYVAYMNGLGAEAWDNPEQHMIEYLQTPEAQGILQKWAAEVFKVTENISITGEQIAALSQELAAEYQIYASKNGLPDPAKIGEHYLAYINTEDGKRRLSEGIVNVVDVDSLKTQVSKAVGDYMNQSMGAYTGAMAQVLETQISSALGQIVTQITGGLEGALQQSMGQIGTRIESAMGNAMSIDEDAFAKAFKMNMSGDELGELLMSMGSAENASYDNNLQKLGYVDFAIPSSIDLYPIDFESKENVIKILDDYNSRMEKEGKDEQVITYTDMVGTLMSSVTEIIDVISYVLIAFVAISLVVSSIMIGVITYISVLERKKEIGILRAIGASKGNISQIFNAETFIIGLCAGVLGIGISSLLLIPGNMLIHHLANRTDINAVLPIVPAMMLIGISVLLTLLGGFIPSKKAAKSDPVTALRTE